jgi:hypothetical protein
MAFEYRQNAPVVFGAGVISCWRAGQGIRLQRALCVYDAGGEASAELTRR